MHSLLACFPPKYQIADHEGTVLDVPVVVSLDCREILCCSETRIQMLFLHAIDFEFSGVIGCRLVEVVDPRRSEGYVRR